MQLWSHRFTFAAVSATLSLLSKTAALNIVGFNGSQLSPFTNVEPPANLTESSSPIVQGACYSPFHNAEYPLYGGNAAGLESAMDTDFRIMKDYVSVVRTYYSSFYGYAVAPHAAKYGVSLYLGVFMTDEGWYNDQVNAAIAAVKEYPDTIKAILVGNENVYPAGPYSPAEVLRRVKALRARVLSETGRTVDIGTVQRHNEWTSNSIRTEMLALADGCDIVGVNIYPFFDASYTASDPLAMLNGAWNTMLNLYPSEKVRLTEIGFPTAGAPASFAPDNIPSLSNSINFYKAFQNWSPASGGQEVFWFMFFDRRPDDNTMGIELEKYFGFDTYNRVPKSSAYPNLLGSYTAVTAAPTTAPTMAPTIAPTIAPTSAPTMAPTSAPTRATTAATTPAGTSTQVCRVHKVFTK